ncbi:MAG: alpha/beta fold hydrolase [Nocardioides sp.]
MKQPSIGTDRLTTYEHDGLRFDVLDDGPLEGDIVVLLHGFPERASCWRDVAPLLHAAGLRTLAPDQRGYSPGARPSRRRDYRLRLLAQDVIALIEQTDQRVHLVGHDWGAVVAWSVATLRPDLLRSLTAVSVPHPEAFLRAMLTSRQGLKSYYMGVFQLPWVPEVMARKPGGLLETLLGRGGMTRDELGRFRTEIVEYGALQGGLGWYRALPFLDRSLLGTKVNVPTTLVWSDDDAFLARSGVDRTPHHVDGEYELVVLEGVTHWIPTQAAEPLAAAVLARISTS